MSEAGLDGFVGNPVRVIGKSSEEENMQIASLTGFPGNPFRPASLIC